MKNIIKSSCKNIIDGVVTTLVGTGVMVMTVIMLWTGKISFMWEGVLGLVVGCILLIAPRDITKLIGDYFKSKKDGEDIPPNPPRDI